MEPELLTFENPLYYLLYYVFTGFYLFAITHLIGWMCNIKLIEWALSSGQKDRS